MELLKYTTTSALPFVSRNHYLERAGQLTLYLMSALDSVAEELGDRVLFGRVKNEEPRNLSDPRMRDEDFAAMLVKMFEAGETIELSVDTAKVLFSCPVDRKEKSATLTLTTDQNPGKHLGVETVVVGLCGFLEETRIASFSGNMYA